MSASAPHVWVATKRGYPAGHPFWNAGNDLRDLDSLLRGDQPDLNQESVNWCPITCRMQRCKETFSSIFEYEKHYHAAHSHECSVCRRVFPTPFLLDVHISERHDSLFRARIARGESLYVCLVEDCTAPAMKTPSERSVHLTATHGFPENFTFEKTVTKVYRNRRKTQTGKIDTKSTLMETQHTSGDTSAGSSTREVGVMTSKYKGPQKSDVVLSGSPGRFEGKKGAAWSLPPHQCSRHVQTRSKNRPFSAPLTHGEKKDQEEDGGGMMIEASPSRESNASVTADMDVDCLAEDLAKSTAGLGTSRFSYSYSAKSMPKAFAFGGRGRGRGRGR